MWKNLSNYSDLALLLLRVTLGSFFIWVHGWPKLAAGIVRWKELGTAMKHVGITFWPGFWGFMAACSESLGMILIIAGLLFRPSCLMLFITMTVAATWQYHGGGWSRAAHPLELSCFFLAFVFIGPGKYSVDRG